MSFKGVKFVIKIVHVSFITSSLPQELMIRSEASQPTKTLKQSMQEQPNRIFF